MILFITILVYLNCARAFEHPSSSISVTKNTIHEFPIGGFSNETLDSWSFIEIMSEGVLFGFDSMPSGVVGCDNMLSVTCNLTRLGNISSHELGLLMDSFLINVQSNSGNITYNFTQNVSYNGVIHVNAINPVIQAPQTGNGVLILGILCAVVSVLCICSLCFCLLIRHRIETHYSEFVDKIYHIRDESKSSLQASSRSSIF